MQSRVYFKKEKELAVIFYISQKELTKSKNITQNCRTKHEIVSFIS